MTACSRNITTATLSDYYSHLLPASEEAALDAHVGQCAACTAHLAAYAAIRQGLRQQRSPIDGRVVWRQLDARIAMTRGGFMQGTSRVAWLSGATLLTLFIIAFVAVFALRQPHQTVPSTSVTPTATATASATATVTASATTATSQALTPQQFAHCFPDSGSSVSPATVIRVGDIAFADFIGPLAYPSRVLPEGVSSPYKLTGDPTGNFAASFVGQADPFDGTADQSQPAYMADFGVEICNLSATATHHVTELGATITHFTAYTGSLNVWVPPPCTSTYYSSASQQVVGSSGCGGYYPSDMQATATFPSGDIAGTAVTDTLTGNTTVAPGASVSAALTLNLPGQPGIYTLTPFLKIDGGAKSDGTPGAPYLYAPIAHVWDGQACAQAAIPASPAAYYICRN